MRRALSATFGLVLILVAVIARADPPAEVGSGPPGENLQPRVTLVWLDQQLPYSLDTVAGEVERIFDGTGVKIAWKVIRPDTVYRLRPAELNLHVFLLDRSFHALQAADGPVMGAVTAVPEAQHTIRVSFPSVLETLGWSAESTCLHRIQVKHEISRALGRVIVHEIVHAIDPTIPHTSHGLMREHLGRWDLTGGEPRLDAKTAVAVCTRLRSVRESLPAVP